MDQGQDILLDVADPEVSARFYGRLLQGRAVLVGPDRAMLVLASGRRLNLWRRGAEATEPARAVGFAVDRASDVDDLHVDWWDGGARILTPPKPAMYASPPSRRCSLSTRRRAIKRASFS